MMLVPNIPLRSKRSTLESIETTDNSATALSQFLTTDCQENEGSKSEHHGPIYISWFVFWCCPGETIMLEGRIEHVLAMAGRFHPGIEDGLCTALSRCDILCRRTPYTCLPQSRHETIAPTDAMADLSITRHPPGLVK